MNIQTEQETPAREIRAVYDECTIRVYQAYSNAIADSALAAGTFVEPEFKMGRMTWVKPSFLWMMYRCGWGTKDSGQSRILAIDIKRSGFEWALANSCSSHPQGMTTNEAKELMARTPVRIQWDPERDSGHRPLQHRSIQIGLRGEAVDRYVTDWIVEIHDVSSEAARLHALRSAGDHEALQQALPIERPYPLDPTLSDFIGATPRVIGQVQ